MISEKSKDYCREDISLIENYDKAIADETQIWVCHHRLEITLNVKLNWLKRVNLYYDRPASELIYLTQAEHMRIHRRKLYKEDNRKTKQRTKFTENIKITDEMLEQMMF